MRRITICIITGIVIILFLVFSFLYIFNIYEVTYSVNPHNLFADSSSTVMISTKPVNAFGWKTPFRNAPANFNINEGRDLINIITEDNNKGLLIIQAKNKPGKILISVKSLYALLPSSLEINIFSK